VATTTNNAARCFIGGESWEGRRGRSTAPNCVVLANDAARQEHKHRRLVGERHMLLVSHCSWTMLRSTAPQLENKHSVIIIALIAGPPFSSCGGHGDGQAARRAYAPLRCYWFPMVQSMPLLVTICAAFTPGTRTAGSRDLRPVGSLSYTRSRE
jgi:hypothetical protein